MRRSPSPGRLKFVPPQLPRLVETPPESDDWIPRNQVRRVPDPGHHRLGRRAGLYEDGD